MTSSWFFLSTLKFWCWQKWACSLKTSFCISLSVDQGVPQDIIALTWHLCACFIKIQITIYYTVYLFHVRLTSFTIEYTEPMRLVKYYLWQISISYMFRHPECHLQGEFHVKGIKPRHSNWLCIADIRMFRLLKFWIYIKLISTSHEETEMGGACSAYGVESRGVYRTFGGETWGKETTWETQA